uniref:Uncharacterized protein n=2 Tax=Zea mays TaxID=4577 RepID=A0A804PLE3_MAIZE
MEPPSAQAMSATDDFQDKAVDECCSCCYDCCSSILDFLCCSSFGDDVCNPDSNHRSIRCLEFLWVTCGRT